MIGWLRRLFRRPGRHEIFRFRLDGRWAYRDPVLIRRLLHEQGGEEWPLLVEAVYKLARDASHLGEDAMKMRAAEQEKAAADLAELVGKAFRVPRLTDDGRGMTESQLIDLMGEFLDWCFEVVEETRPLAFASPSTVTTAGD